MKDGIKENSNNYLVYLMYIALAVALGMVFFFSLMANGLVNNLDGIWHPSNFIAGDWEISLGRGLQRYADRARFGLVSSSWNSIICFALIGIGDVLLIKKMSLEKSAFSFLLILISIVNPVIAESLSYSYMSVNFALAFLLSVISFYFIPFDKKNIFRNSVISCFAFAVSMAFYQAYIGVFATCCLLFAIGKLLKLQNIKKVLMYLINCLIVFVLGGGIYYAITELLLFRAGIEMASYKGADNVGVISIIKNVPWSFIKTYKEFWNYVIVNKMNTNLEFSRVMSIFVAILILGIFLVQFVKVFRKNKKNAFLMLFLFALIPCGTCIIVMIAVDNSITGLMAMGIVSIFMMFYTVVENAKWEKNVYYVVIAVLMWYWIGTVENDQIALKEGITATTTIATEIMQDVNDCSDYEYGNRIAFVGRTADNPCFYVSEAYNMANGYAQFGKWSTDPRNNRVTWSGIYNVYCGRVIPICDDETYSQLILSQEVEEMPIYPEEGYMQLIDDVLVVKVSDLY